MLSVCCDYARCADLRFTEEATEREFKRSVEVKLVVLTLALCMISMFVFVSTMIQWMVKEITRTDDPLRFSFEDPRAVTFLGYFLNFLVFPMLLLVLGVARLRKCCARSLDWETLVTFSLTSACVSPALINGWTVAALFREDPALVWLHDVRYIHGSTALLLDATITVLCLFLPIRMILKWIPPTCGCIAFGVSTLGISSPYPEAAMADTFVLSGLAVCSLWGAWNNEREARQRWIAEGRVTRKTSQLQQQHTGVYRILDRLSDGLVHINADCSILDPNPRLAALLLYRTAESLQNMSFIDFLASDQDQKKFTSALHGVDSNGGMVHVHLRDSCGREFGVYAYHTRIYDDDGECGNLVALIEAQERQAFEDDSIPVNVPDDEEYAEIDIACDAAESELSSSFVDTAVWIDSGALELTIMNYTPGFQIIGPVKVGDGLSPMITKDIELFRHWLQVSLKPCEQGGDVTVPPYFSMRLRPIPDASIEISAKCKIDIDCQAPDLHTEVTQGLPLRLVFSDLSCHKVTPPSHKYVSYVDHISL